VPEAEPADVRSAIDTELENSEIKPFLDEAAHDAATANDTTAMDTADLKLLEKYLAAYKIRATRDRAIASADRQSASVEYEGSPLAELESAIERYDPSGTLPNTGENDFWVMAL